MFPWNKDDKTEKDREIEELNQRVEELESEIDSYKQRYEAEKERRSKLSAEKQKAERERNKLKDKLESLKSSEETKEDNDSQTESWKIGYKQGVRILEKLNSIESPEKDLIPVKSDAQLGDIPDLKGLKNAANKEQISFLQSKKSFLGFLEPDLINTVLFTRPFLGSEWQVGKKFDLEDILEFIRREKYWVLVSANKTKLLKEKNGEIEEIDSVKTRVDKKHSQGGFSQGRFERKRDKQIESHVKKTEELLKDVEEPLLLGERELCKQLDGQYLGGFDRNRRLVDALYNFRIQFANF